MAARSRFSTSTVIDSEYLVPWLSAEEPLAYSPTKPPARNYFFQYSWILPGIFNPQINLREHRYFGCPLQDSARFLFDFWANARRGDGPALQRYCQFGFFSVGQDQGIGFGATRTHLYKGVNELSRRLGIIFLLGTYKKDLPSSIPRTTRFFSGCQITPIGVTLNCVAIRTRPEVEARAFDLCRPRFRAF
jgi:hypothetical protein